MTNKFKVGVRGVTTLVDHSHHFTIEVKWDNGCYNMYREEDLKHYEEGVMGHSLADGSVHTDYQVGDTFVRTSGGTIDKGTVVTVTSEDFHTPCPLVEHGHGKSNYSCWRYLTPTPETLRKVRERKGFKPSDLKDGMVVTLRDGRQGIVFGGRIERMFDDIRNHGLTNGLIRVEHYNDSLTADDNSYFDIMKVSYMGEVLWEREGYKKQKELEELYRQIDELKEKADKIKGG